VAVGRVLEGQAFAALVAAEPAAAPITFESEAEKPTRAPARRKTDEGATEAAPEEPAAEDVEVAEAVPAESEGDGAESDETEAPPAKKRSRRGSRGGKRRKKPASSTADADSAEADTETDAEPDVAPTSPPSEDAAPSGAPKPRRRKPKIHVPNADGAPTDEAEAPEALPADVTAAEPVADGAERGGDEQPAPTEGVPRKRTRRGSRGGKNRRKRAAANGDGAAAAQPDESGATALEPEGGRAPETPVDEPVSVPAATPSEPGNGDGYVPMSEWIEDFDRRP